LTELGDGRCDHVGAVGHAELGCLAVDGENDLGLRDLMKKMMLKRLMLAEDKPADSSGKANEDE
jgi:hypothetical protein